MGLLMLPTVFGAAVYQLNILLGTLLASYLPVGSVSYLYYADRLVQFPLGVFGIAVSTAALPSLSALAAKRDMDGFGGALRSAMGLTLFIALPAAAGLLALAVPLISLLFERGAFSAQAVTATAQALAAYSVGLPFIALARPLVAGFYALEDTRTPVRIAVACLVVNIGLGAWLMTFWAHVGLAVAVSASSLANFALLFWKLRARLGHSPLELGGVARSLALSCLIGAGAWFSASWSGWWLALIPVWVIVYFAGAVLLRMTEARMLLDMVRSRIARKKGRA
jgi:putative peptidoglycan lipid II flippase